MTVQSVNLRAQASSLPSQASSLPSEEAFIQSASASVKQTTQRGRFSNLNDSLMLQEYGRELAGIEWREGTSAADERAIEISRALRELAGTRAAGRVTTDSRMSLIAEERRIWSEFVDLTNGLIEDLPEGDPVRNGLITLRQRLWR